MKKKKERERIHSKKDWREGGGGRSMKKKYDIIVSGQGKQTYWSLK